MAGVFLRIRSIAHAGYIRNGGLLIEKGERYEHKSPRRCFDGY